mmetsp:Transcript_55396/g.125893  ORF Transcript_55396/g.125893 Transcript_55396/m.125893 type:complete len:208 (-) Transcript_55396:343-966(-)
MLRRSRGKSSGEESEYQGISPPFASWLLRRFLTRSMDASSSNTRASLRMRSVTRRARTRQQTATPLTIASCFRGAASKMVVLSRKDSSHTSCPPLTCAHSIVNHSSTRNREWPVPNEPRWAGLTDKATVSEVPVAGKASMRAVENAVLESEPRAEDGRIVPCKRPALGSTRLQSLSRHTGQKQRAFIRRIRQSSSVGRYPITFPRSP